MPSSRINAIILAISSSVLSSVATLFKVQGVQTVPPVLAAAVGIFFAGLLTWPYLLWTKRLPTRAALRSVRKPLLTLILLRPVFSNIVFTIGLSMTSGIKAVFLTKMEPYLVIFWVWVLDHKRPSGRHLALLLIHVAGAILLSCGANLALDETQWGDLIVFTAVISAALSYRVVPRVTKVLTPIQTSTITETVGGTLTLPLALLVSPLVFSSAEQVGWLYVGVHSILFYVFAVTFLYASLSGIEGWLSSALRASGPLVAAPIAWLFFGERLSGVQLFGGLIVLLTSALISRVDRRKA